MDDLSQRFEISAGTTRNYLSVLCQKSNSPSMAVLVWKILKGKMPR